MDDSNRISDVDWKRKQIKWIWVSGGIYIYIYIYTKLFCMFSTHRLTSQLKNTTFHCSDPLRGFEALRLWGLFFFFSRRRRTNGFFHCWINRSFDITHRRWKQTSQTSSFFNWRASCSSQRTSSPLRFLQSKSCLSSFVRLGSSKCD